MIDSTHGIAMFWYAKLLLEQDRLPEVSFFLPAFDERAFFDRGSAFAGFENSMKRTAWLSL